jgi:tetratricopeptide (TPR) repeat protein
MNAHKTVGDLLEQARSLFDGGQLARTRAVCEEILRTDSPLTPDSIAPMLQLARRFQKNGHIGESDALFNKVLTQYPDNAQALTGLGFSAFARGAYPEAAGRFQQVLARDSTHAEAHYGLGVCLVQLGKPDQALSNLREAVRLSPDYLAAWQAILGLMTRQRDNNAILKACDEVLRIQPDNTDARAISAWYLARMRKHEQAAQRLRPVLASSGDNLRVGKAFAALAEYMHRHKEAADSLEQLLTKGIARRPDDRREVLFELGRLYDAQGEYDKAFACYRQANDLVIDEISRQFIDERTRLGETRVARLLEAHSREKHPHRPRASTRSDLPVFILGMPRSGTTLVEQILVSHPQVESVGEWNLVAKLTDTLPERIGCAEPYPWNIERLTEALLDDLAVEYLQRLKERVPGARRVLNKTPGNFNLLGLIDMLFPGARVIHCARNPLDTCLSIYFHPFRNRKVYSGELTDVGRLYRQYRRLMEQWHEVVSIPVMKLRYEDLVEQPEAVTRELVEFCGLPWDERCLRFYEGDRYIRSASHNQASKPIYRHARERWKNYAAHLEPLRSLLGDDAQDW